MSKPKVAIDVDEDTGVWSTDGLPMLYMPRHFFVNNHRAVEASLGRERYATQLYRAGFQSAWTWCDHEASRHEMTGIDVFHHYMRRISERGWGQFDGSAISPDTLCGSVNLHNSCLALQAGESIPDARICYLFSGWFPGALAWVGGETAETTLLICEEVQCVGEGASHCVFEVSRR